MFELTGTTTIPTGRRRKASLAWHDDGTITGDLRLMSEAERLIARRGASRRRRPARAP